MKKILLLFLFFGYIGFGQTKGISYQALILDPINQELPGVEDNKAPLADKNICLKFAIIDEFNTIEYEEIFTTKTDNYGMVNLIIGTETKTGGYASSFEDIKWSSLPKNLKIDLSVDPSCSNFSEISNAPFTAVPFALFAINTQDTSLTLDNQNEISLLKNLLATTQINIGVGTDGKYTADPTTNYINAVPSLKEADTRLDLQIKENENKLITKIATSSIVNDLTTGGTGVPLSAEQGKNLKNLVDNAIVINIEDQLASNSTTSALSANQGRVLKGFTDTNTNDISTNNSGIATNVANIAINATDISSNLSNINTNTNDISTNTSGIATNVANIAINATDISSNLSNINTNTNDISTNTSGIATNVANITTNATDISSNLSNINTNTNDISTNTSGIATNVANIATNAANIASNDTDINSNLININTNTNNIIANSSRITKINTLSDGKIYLGNSSNSAVETRITGDISVTNTGVVTINDKVIDLTSKVTQVLPIANGGTGSNTAPMIGVITATNETSARNILQLGSAAITDVTEYATAAQGTTADNALQLTGGKMTGEIDMGANNISNTGTVTATSLSGDLNGTINTATTATTQNAGDNSTKVATTEFVNTEIAAGTSATVSSVNNHIQSSTNDSNAVTNGTEYSATASIAAGSRIFNSTKSVNTFNAGIDLNSNSIVSITLSQAASVTSGPSTYNIQPVVTNIDATNNTFTITTYAFGSVLAPNTDFTFNFFIIK
jgi:hypothetical protein